MKRILLVLAPIAILLTTAVKSQDAEVRKCLQYIAEGKTVEAKQLLPDLLAEYPNDPGVQLLHASVIENANTALDKYMNIITEHPESEWADDAYWRVVQYYSVVGDTTQALMHLKNFRKKYPDSEFLLPAHELVRMALNVNRLSYEKKSSKKKSPKKKEAEVKEKMIPAPVAKPPDEKEKAEETAAEKETPVAKGKYGLQVGIYSTRESAEKELEKYKKYRMLAEVKEKELDGETMYAVVIGSYQTKEAADNAKHIVQQQCKCMPIIFIKKK